MKLLLQIVPPQQPFAVSSISTTRLSLTALLVQHAQFVYRKEGEQSNIYKMQETESSCSRLGRFLLRKKILSLNFHGTVNLNWYPFLVTA